MKKSVIKRRKRVPAAGTTGGLPPFNRMSDQAAAEALVSVGRPAATDDSDGETDQPRRKRARRSKSDKNGDDEDDSDELSGSKSRWSGPGQRASPFIAGHGGFELPPLNLAGPGGPAPYMRSGSKAPSRTHSPLNPSSQPPMSYSIPPPAPGMSPFYTGPPGPASAPLTLADLEKHYMDIYTQKRRLEELLGRTERIMGEVKRGIDEMRGAGTSASSALALPLPRPGSGDKDRRERESVWPLTSGPGESRD